MKRLALVILAAMPMAAVAILAVLFSAERPAVAAASTTKATAPPAQQGLLTAAPTGVDIDFTSHPAPPPPPPVPGAGEIRWVYAETSFTARDARTPIKIKDVRPKYAPMAIALGVQGTIVLDATIDARGHVTRMRLLESLPLLSQATIDAVRQWRFDPATIGAAPVIVTVRASYVPPQ